MLLKSRSHILGQTLQPARLVKTDGGTRSYQGRRRFKLRVIRVAVLPCCARMQTRRAYITCSTTTRCGGVVERTIAELSR
jgi:hypothetical protein